MSAIPFSDAQALGPLARRTLIVRAALLLAAGGVVIALLVASRDPHSQTLAPLPTRADTVLVLDLSASIWSDSYGRIGTLLASVARGGGRIGLVLFSDDAYVALPPGTPAADLAPFVRYFEPLRPITRGTQPAFPANPWQTTFSAGTKISAGLALAHGLVQAGGHRRADVVLVSDLDDSIGDRDRLAGVLLGYKRERVPLRVVGLSPTKADQAFFRGWLGSGVKITQAPRASKAPPPRRQTPFPWALVALAAAAAAVLAAHELWAPRLEWRR